jgi:hypothetical protein
MYVQVRMLMRKFLGSKDACNEGELRSMYLDNRGFVTTGVGNKLDSAKDANAHKWERLANGTAADPTEVTAEFVRVGSGDTKSKIVNWATIGGGAFIIEAKKLGIVTVQLTSESFRKIFEDKREWFDENLKKITEFQDFDKMPGGFPADAELGIFGVIWATGLEPLKPGGYKQAFSTACQAREWGKIAADKKYHWANISPQRDRTLQKVFENAQKIEDQRTKKPSMDVTIISPPFSDLFLER